MKNLGILLLIIYIGLSSFGVFGMHALMPNNDADCLAATFLDADCPLVSGSLTYINFHLDAYKGFSLAIFSENISENFLFIFSLFLVGALVFFQRLHLSQDKLIFSKQRYRYRNSFISHQKQNINKWLAQHINSPAFFS